MDAADRAPLLRQRSLPRPCFPSGYAGVVMVPTFGTERRGAPVFTSLKISREKIYDLSPIEKPDIIVVLDHVLLEEANITSGLKEDGLIVVNSPCSIDDYRFDGRKVAICDVTSLSIKGRAPRGHGQFGHHRRICQGQRHHRHGCT
ncbi:MAG: 2-oxoacid:acceptor oxidoreductase family protein [Desulfosudis oleivorans]|nr:2-oxoacid:acceptor oxidoreductase family protein [Desulfosudis oleivorans]